MCTGNEGRTGSGLSSWDGAPEKEDMPPSHPLTGRWAPLPFYSDQGIGLQEWEVGKRAHVSLSYWVGL